MTPKKQAIPAILALSLAAGVARAGTEAPKTATVVPESRSSTGFGR